MQYRILRFPVLALLFLNGFLFGSANLVEAQQGSLNARLNGTYSFHLLKHCNRETGGAGFNANLQFATGIGITGIGMQVQGTVTFDGSGSANATTTDVVTLVSGGAVVHNQETCTFTYVVSSDGSFTLQGTCSGTQVAGGSPGTNISTMGIKLKGQIGTRRRTLIFFGDGPTIETFQFGANPLQEQICSQTGTAVRAS